MTRLAKRFEPTCNAAAGTGTGLSNEVGGLRGMEPNKPRLFHPIHHGRDAAEVPAWYKIEAIGGHLTDSRRVSIVTSMLLAAAGASFGLARYAHRLDTGLLRS